MIKRIIFSVTILFYTVYGTATEAGVCLDCKTKCLPEIAIDLNPKTICKISQLAINNLKKELTEAIIEEGNLDEQVFSDLTFPKINPENGDIIYSKANKAVIKLKETKLQDIEIEIKSTKCDNHEIEVTVVLTKLKANTKLSAFTPTGEPLFREIDATIATSNSSSPSEFYFKAKVDSEKGLGDFLSIDESSGKSKLKPNRLKIFLDDGDRPMEKLSIELNNEKENILNLKPTCPHDLMKEMSRTLYLQLKSSHIIPEKCDLKKQTDALNKIKDNPKNIFEIVITSDLYHHPAISQILNQGLDKIAQKKGFFNRGNLTSLINIQFLANQLSNNDEFVNFLNPLTTEILKPVAAATNRGIKNLPKAIEKGLRQIPAFNLNSGEIEGSVSYDELFAVLQQGARGAKMNLFQKDNCDKTDLKILSTNTANSDFSVNFSLKAIEGYFSKIKDKGFLKICTGSDDINCSGGRWLDIKETPSLRFQDGKLKIKLKHLVSIGNFETDFDLNLTKCDNSFCFKLSNPNTQVKSTGLVGFVLKTFNINGIIDTNFSEKFDTVNSKAAKTDLGVEIISATIDPKDERIEMDFKIKD
jgi:hypothetical protein